MRTLPGKISFWHGSFRDYFCAFHLSKLSKEEIYLFASNPKNASIIPFIIGIVKDPTPLVQILIEIVQGSETMRDRLDALHALARAGQHHTLDIVRAISAFNYDEVIGLANSILAERSFQGGTIYWHTMDLVYEKLGHEDTVGELLEDINFEDLEGYIHEAPQLTEKDYDVIITLYTSILVEIAEGQVQEAENYYRQLVDYRIGPLLENMGFDHWLTSRELHDTRTFVEEFRAGRIDKIDLHEFCRNTYLLSSLPFLKFILENSENLEMRLEAHLALQSIRRSYRIAYRTNTNDY